MTLNEQQAAGLEKVVAWYDNEYNGYPGGADVFRWFGYAGTGKTYSAARIPERLGINNVVFGTYTGKAASVLRRSLTRYGVDYPVTTIHSAIYKPTVSKRAMEELQNAQDELSELLNAPVPTIKHGEEYVQLDQAELMAGQRRIEKLQALIPELEKNAKRLRFELNPDSEWAHADLIILDEVSMVNAKLAADIESFGAPILVLGDPAQLPPVEGGGYYTEAKPNVLLTKVERQAGEDNPVLELATRVRTSNTASLGLTAADMTKPSLQEVLAADIVLTWTNRRRWNLTNHIRAALGRGPHPEPGDTVMVLTNNSEAAVFNGQLFTIATCATVPAGYDMTVVDDEGITRALSTYRDGFVGQEEQARAKGAAVGARGQRVLATYGQVITVHKAQGSEWQHVYLVNEARQLMAMTAKRLGAKEGMEQAKRWLYTGCTRASERVTITHPM